MVDEMNELREHYDRTDTSAELERAELEQPERVAEPMVTYALRLPEPVLEALRSAAEERGVRVSALMRGWLEERLGSESGGQAKMIAVDEILAFVARRAR